MKPVIRSFYNPGLSDHLNATSPTNMTLTAAASTTEPDLDSYDYDDFGQNQSLSDLLLWESNHSENISLEPQIPFKRIVGGRSAAPGEIPWQVPFRRTDIRNIVTSCTTFCFYPLVCSSVSFFQVGLIAKPSGQLFCGGSILSERWVITAAHCLKEASGSFSVRVGKNHRRHTELLFKAKYLQQYSPFHFLFFPDKYIYSILNRIFWYEILCNNIIYLVAFFSTGQKL